MYGDEFSGFSGRTNIVHDANRNMQFLEMALPGLCMTCARAGRQSSGELSIVDPNCSRCIGEPRSTLIDMKPTMPQWWTETNLYRQNQRQLQKPHNPYGNQLQGHMPQGHMPQGHMPQGHMPQGHRASWDSVFSTESGSSLTSYSTDDSLSFNSEPIKNNSATSSTESEWPDWSKWLNKNNKTTRPQIRVRNSFDSTGPPPLILENVDVSDEAPCLSRSPSPIQDESSLVQSRFEPKVEPKVEPRAPPAINSALMHPAKTGFALWVGNLSPKTTLPDLRMLFGTPDLQSIYLIQRTGCAFVNYTTLPALELGMRLFESRGARLHDHNLVIKAQVSNPEEDCLQTSKVTPEGPTSAPDSLDRYFICKSLTVDDLDMAKKTGKWSTQLRNKDKFNLAFSQSQNTYLVFSANRTSAFYGIARLEEMFQDPTSESKCACHGDSGAQCPMAPITEECRHPEVSYTAPCYHPQDHVQIPPGETVFDPLRGSQFWKVEGCPCVEPETEKWTTPATIKWISAANAIIPFSRTRQLKNSFNMNKPIKVARDGTEIDPDIGNKLYSMFLTTIS